ncbi:FecCD family ABC transporter permease [Couchioplanes azureus]|uniref:FecCD family ABC transporter permease n=1 Tax=Couchioplanes caeruleus TaxID=56438 RepID=UPI00357104A0
MLRDRRDRLSVRVRPRPAIVAAALIAALAGVTVATITTGDYPISALDAVRALWGAGDPASEFIVTTLRLPRLVTGLVVGIALGVSGAITQSLSRNPLASPDIIGLTSGAATGAILVVVVLHGSMIDTALGAVAGAVGTSVLVYLLAFKNGVQGFRLILVGIGVSAMILSVNSYLIARAAWQDAIAAQAWLVGGLNGRGWEHAEPVLVATALLLPVALLQARRLSLLEMGDAAATALGVPVERSRLLLLGVSVLLAGVATAAAGPIAFLALVAPQLAHRLTRSAGPGLLAAGLMGALLLTASDLAVQRLFAPAQLPVGIATAGIGGSYLAWLLAHQWRRGPR